MKKIIITGGAGFLGQKLAHQLLQGNTFAFDQLLLLDIIEPPVPNNDPRVISVALDLSNKAEVAKLIDDQCVAIFHLAAIVSSHAESDFDLGMQVNFDITRTLLELCRESAPKVKFIFTSSLAVFGGKLPEVITDGTAVTPQSSYGAEKAMGELLVNDYIRKGFVDGCVVRLPTICVRPGKPNKAASSFVSSIIREPLQGDNAVCPVNPALELWLSSPAFVIKNIIYAATLQASDFGAYRTINLPGITVSVEAMLQTLKTVGGQEAFDRVEFKEDAGVNAIVSSWPGKFDVSTAQKMGFVQNNDFSEIIQEFMKNDICLN